MAAAGYHDPVPGPREALGGGVPDSGGAAADECGPGGDGRPPAIVA